MVILGINTASKKTEICLIEDPSKRIIDEKSWVSASNEAEKLLPEILKLLKKNSLTSSLTFKDIKKIIVVKGPGSFTGLRVGIAIANMIAYLLKIPVHGIDTFTFLGKSFNPKITRQKNAKLVLFAGKKEVYMKKNPKAAPALIHINSLTDNHNADILYGELHDEQIPPLKQKFISKRDSLGETLIKLTPKDMKKEKIITPVYIKGPGISTPKPIK